MRAEAKGPSTPAAAVGQSRAPRPAGGCGGQWQGLGGPWGPFLGAGIERGESQSLQVTGVGLNCCAQIKYGIFIGVPAPWRNEVP